MAMIPSEITVWVYGGYGLSGRKTGQRKFSCSFGVGSKEFKTSEILCEDKVQWNEQNSIPIKGTKKPLVISIFDDGKKFGKIKIPIEEIQKTMPIEFTKTAIKPSKKYPLAYGHIEYKCWASQFSAESSGGSKLSIRDSISSLSSGFVGLKKQTSMLVRKQKPSALGEAPELTRNSTIFRPRITIIKPKEVFPGEKVTVRGRCFGNSEDSIESIYICDKLCQQYVVESPSLIHLVLPEDLPAGKTEIIITTKEGGRGVCLASMIIKEKVDVSSSSSSVNLKTPSYTCPITNELTSVPVPSPQIKFDFAQAEDQLPKSSVESVAFDQNLEEPTYSEMNPFYSAEPQAKSEPIGDKISEFDISNRFNPKKPNEPFLVESKSEEVEKLSVQNESPQNEPESPVQGTHQELFDESQVNYDEIENFEFDAFQPSQFLYPSNKSRIENVFSQHLHQTQEHESSLLLPATSCGVNEEAQNFGSKRITFEADVNKFQVSDASPDLRDSQSSTHQSSGEYNFESNEATNGRDNFVVKGTLSPIAKPNTEEDVNRSSGEYKFDSNEATCGRDNFEVKGTLSPISKPNTEEDVNRSSGEYKFDSNEATCGRDNFVIKGTLSPISKPNTEEDVNCTSKEDYFDVTAKSGLKFDLPVESRSNHSNGSKIEQIPSSHAKMISGEEEKLKSELVQIKAEFDSHKSKSELELNRALSEIKSLEEKNDLLNDQLTKLTERFSRLLANVMMECPHILEV